jgi:predicted CopG family antitoxin
LSLNGPDGGVGICLDYATVAKLRAMRGRGDSFSDVILALAKDERV